MLYGPTRSGHGFENVVERPVAILPEMGRVLAVMGTLEDIEWTVLLKPQEQIPARRHRTREAGSGVGVGGAPLDILKYQAPMTALRHVSETEEMPSERRTTASGAVDCTT